MRNEFAKWRDQNKRVFRAKTAGRELLENSQGFREFLGWKDIDFHRGSHAEAARELLARLVERFSKRSNELRQMPLLDAVRLLTQPENFANHIERAPRPSEAVKPAVKRKYTRGKLDEQAAIELTKNPPLPTGRSP